MVWPWNTLTLLLTFKAHSHSLQQSVVSAVDCVNAEIGIFLSLRHNATVQCRICTCLLVPMGGNFSCFFSSRRPPLSFSSLTNAHHSPTTKCSIYTWAIFDDTKLPFLTTPNAIFDDNKCHFWRHQMPFLKTPNAIFDDTKCLFWRRQNCVWLCDFRRAKNRKFVN